MLVLPHKDPPRAVVKTVLPPLAPGLARMEVVAAGPGGGPLPPSAARPPASGGAAAAASGWAASAVGLPPSPASGGER